MVTREQPWGPLGTLGAFAGMAALFAYYRSATFMGSVFPTEIVGSGGAPEWLVNPAVPLTVLAVAVAAACWGALGTWLASSRTLAAALGPLGSCGAAVALLVRADVLPSACEPVAVVLCSVSFVGAVLLAGPRLCSMGAVRMVGVLVSAYLVAYALFVLVRYTPLVQGVALATPALATLPWLLGPSGGFGGAIAVEGPEPEEAAVEKRGGAGRCLRSPVLWLSMLLVLASGMVRSLLGTGLEPNGLRTLTCFSFAIALLACWAVVALVAARDPERGSRLLAKTLVAYAALLVGVFLAAVFAYLVFGWEDGVYVVASARSTFDCLWWVAMCAVVRREKLPVVPSFLLWGCATWALQWLACYWLLPNLLFTGPEVSPWGVVVAVLLLLVCALLTLCAALLGAQWRRSSAGMRGVGDEARVERDGEGVCLGRDDEVPTAADKAADAARRLVRGYGLTEREAQVAVLFAEGFSLGAVADRLGMGKSTAQSHSKAIYRKCGIHTKDELIAIVRGE